MTRIRIKWFLLEQSNRISLFKSHLNQELNRINSFKIFWFVSWINSFFWKPFWIDSEKKESFTCLPISICAGLYSKLGRDIIYTRPRRHFLRIRIFLPCISSSRHHFSISFSSHNFPTFLRLCSISGLWSFYFSLGTHSFVSEIFFLLPSPCDSRITHCCSDTFRRAGRARQTSRQSSADEQAELGRRTGRTQKTIRQSSEDQQSALRKWADERGAPGRRACYTRHTSRLHPAYEQAAPGIRAGCTRPTSVLRRV